MATNREVDIKVMHYPVYDVCEDETFVSPMANRRLGHLYPDTLAEQIHRPLGASGVIGAYMAGMRCPNAERMAALVRDVSGIEDWEKHAVRELFGQLSPEECFEFVITTNATPREVARLMRESGVRRGVVVNWVNQFSSDPNWREDKMLAIQFGESQAANRRPRPKKKPAGLER